MHKSRRALERASNAPEVDADDSSNALVLRRVVVFRAHAREERDGKNSESKLHDRAFHLVEEKLR